MAARNLVTIATAPDVAAANLLRGALEAAEIPSFIPDEQTAGNLWHVSGALGGVRIQINAGDELRAREILDGLDQPVPALDDAEEVSAADRGALRALRIALVGFFLWPIIHPYALSLAMRSLGDAGLSSRGRRQARIALAISLTALVGFLVFLYLLLAA
jgi:hypothetical protein